MESNHSPTLSHSYSQLITQYEKNSAVMWCYANPSPRPCFTPGLLNDLKRFLHNIESRCDPDDASKALPLVKYLVLGSYKPGIFSLGGDLELFIRAITQKDRKLLTEYMTLSIDVLFSTYTNLDSPLTTIALIRGNALGAGFEGALACDYLVAEEGVQLGFPEVLFNMFPGMGAYSFLSRRINQVTIEKMILSGRVYAAEELYEMGIIDVLAKKGEGVESVYRLIKQHEKNGNSRNSLLKIRKIVNPITYQELISIGNLWVDAALSLTERELKVMKRLVRSQDSMAAKLVDKIDLKKTVNL
jgi:DSF synthase